jgi:hypothetical protein
MLRLRRSAAEPVLSVLRLRRFAPTLRMTGSEGLSMNGALPLVLSVAE